MFKKECSCGADIELDGAGWTNDSTVDLGVNEIGLWFDCTRCGSTGLFKLDKSERVLIEHAKLVQELEALCLD